MQFHDSQNSQTIQYTDSLGYWQLDFISEFMLTAHHYAEYCTVYMWRHYNVNDTIDKNLTKTIIYTFKNRIWQMFHCNLSFGRVLNHCGHF